MSCAYVEHYRYTTCKLTDTEHMGVLISKTAGRRLTYGFDLLGSLAGQRASVLIDDRAAGALFN
jgi:hypothetical protein